MRYKHTLVALLLAVTALPAAAAISGIVMTSEGAPVGGARVTLHAHEAPEARRLRLLSATPERVPLLAAETDAKGNFSLQSPKELVVDLRIDARGYDPEVRRVERDEEVGAIALTKRAVSTGLITAAGKPVAGATVVVNYGGVDYTVRTDDKGRYEAPEPKRASAITVIHPDYAIDEERFQSPNTPASELNRALVAGTALSGRAVSADGTTAVAKATISIDGWPLATSGDDGAFTIKHAPARWGSITARTDTLLGQRAFPPDKTLTVRMARAATISGRVLDSKTKVPVAGATVNMFIPRRAAMGEINPSTFTDAKGTFTLLVAAGSYMIMAAHPSFDSQMADVTASLGQQTAKDFSLSRFGRVSGVVVDEEKRPVAVASIGEDELPMRGMSPIRMMRGGSNRTVSGPDGRFSLRVAGDQDIRLRAVKKGLPPAKGESLRVAPGDRKSGIVLVIPTGIAVTGKVKDANGDPLPGVAVSATETNDGGMGGMMSRIVLGGFFGEEEDLVRTSADGSFTLHVKEGTYDFAFKREGYAPKSVRAQNVTVSGGVTIETTLEPAVEIAGRVTRGGAGVAGVSIVTMGTESNAMTGPDGSFTLGNLSPGTVRLLLRKEDELVQEQKTFTAPARDVNVELPIGGTVRGRVVEKGTSKPVTAFTAGVSTSMSGGGMVRMSPPLNRSFTSDDGSFTLEHVPPGALNLIASAPGFAAARTNIEVQEGKVVSDVVLELEAGVKLVGKITDSSGSPVTDAAVMIRPSPTGSFAMTGSIRRTTTDANGEYVLDSLDAGEETISVSHAKHSSVNKTVQLKGRETRLDIQLAGGVRVTGVVVTDSGMPVADAEVRAISSGMMGNSARTNASGAFELESLTPARYRFSASKSGYADATLDDVDVSAGAPLRLIMSSGGTIYGRVTGLEEKDYAFTTVQANSGRNNASAAVDPSGNYRIEGAPTGTVQVMAMVRTPSFDYRTSPSQSVEITAGSSQQVMIEFRGDTVLQGHVTRNGSPLPGASVYFQSTGGGRTGAGVTADDQGMYRVSGLEAGEYRVSVNDMQRGGAYSTTYTLRGSATFDIDYKSGMVRGRVIDASSNEPVADASVTLRATSGDARTNRSAMTDPSGSFVLEHVPAGSYAITAGGNGYGNQMLDLTLGEAGRDGLELKLSRNDGVTLRVVDARDGRPLSAMVTVFDPQGRIVHDNRMMFGGPDPSEIRLPVAPGSYTATVTTTMYAPRSISFTSPSTQTVAMTPGGTILVQSKHSTRRRIRLLDASGMLYPRLGQPITTRDLMPGTLPLERVAPGTYTLQLLETDSDAILATTQVVVREGETVPVSI